jgi:hypothetical protein
MTVICIVQNENYSWVHDFTHSYTYFTSFMSKIDIQNF